MDVNKEKIIDAIAKEFVQVMLRDENKSEILNLYNQGNATMENCAKRWLQNKMNDLHYKAI